MVERLKKFAPYTERNDCLISLVQNYRCNPRILEFPSQQFYGGNLKAMADKSIANKLLEWRKLRNKKFPVMFWSVRFVVLC
jgi:helicase MOV-10